MKSFDDEDSDTEDEMRRRAAVYVLQIVTPRTRDKKASTEVSPAVGDESSARTELFRLVRKIWNAPPITLAFIYGFEKESFTIDNRGFLDVVKVVAQSVLKWLCPVEEMKEMIYKDVDDLFKEQKLPTEAGNYS